MINNLWCILRPIYLTSWHETKSALQWGKVIRGHAPAWMLLACDGCVVYPGISSCHPVTVLAWDQRPELWPLVVSWWHHWHCCHPAPAPTQAHNMPLPGLYTRAPTGPWHSLSLLSVSSVNIEQHQLMQTAIWSQPMTQRRVITAKCWRCVIEMWRCLVFYPGHFIAHLSSFISSPSKNIHFNQKQLACTLSTTDIKDNLQASGGFEGIIFADMIIYGFLASVIISGFDRKLNFVYGLYLISFLSRISSL